MALQGMRTKEAQIILPPSPMDNEKAFLYILLTVMLLGIAILLSVGILSGSSHYNEAISLSKQYYDDSRTTSHFRPDLSLLYITQCSRAQDSLFLKSAALLLSYLVVLVGCLFVLKGIEAYYELTLQKSEVKSALQTSSPGLVLITLGAALVAISIMSRTNLETSFEWGNFRGAASPNPEQLYTEDETDAFAEMFTPVPTR